MNFAQMELLEYAIHRTEANLRLMRVMPLTCRHRRIDVDREAKRLETLYRIKRLTGGKDEES